MDFLLMNHSVSHLLSYHPSHSDLLSFLKECVHIKNKSVSEIFHSFTMDSVPVSIKGQPLHLCTRFYPSPTQGHPPVLEEDIPICIQAHVISLIISFPQSPPAATLFTVNLLSLYSKAPQKSGSNLLSLVLFLPCLSNPFQPGLHPHHSC